MVVLLRRWWFCYGCGDYCVLLDLVDWLWFSCDLVGFLVLGLGVLFSWGLVR